MGTSADVLIFSEPEAAATYALDAMDPEDIQDGDTFVLCDAGGGTVDLIAYTMVSRRPILKLVEAAPGSGALCGGSMLNRRFDDFIVNKLSQHPDWDDENLEDVSK